MQNVWRREALRLIQGARGRPKKATDHPPPEMQILSGNQIQPEGWNARGGTGLRGPKFLMPLRGLGIQPLVSATRGLRHHFSGRPGGPWRGSKRGSAHFFVLNDVAERRWVFQRPLQEGLHPSGSYHGARLQEADPCRVSPLVSGNSFVPVLQMLQQSQDVFAGKHRFHKLVSVRLGAALLVKNQDGGHTRSLPAQRPDNIATSKFLLGNFDLSLFLWRRNSPIW